MTLKYRIVEIKRGSKDWLYFPQFKGITLGNGDSVLNGIYKMDDWQRIVCKRDTVKSYYCFNNKSDALNKIEHHKCHNKSMKYNIIKVKDCGC